MAPIDIVVLAVIGIAFVAVCVRIYRKGTCADCCLLYTSDAADEL